MNWEIHEIRRYKHPHLIEITQSESKINEFLDEEKSLLQETNVLVVKNEVNEMICSL